MTHLLGKLWPNRWPAKAGIALLTIVSVAAPAGASVPAPLSLSPETNTVLTPVLFKYEDLFGRSEGGSKPFRQIDLNGNGILSPGEMKRAFGSRWQSVLSNLDKNADGQVTLEEVESTGDSRGMQSKGRREQAVGSHPGKASGARGNSKSAEPSGSSSGKAGNHGERGRSRGGNGSESRGNSGGNKSASGGGNGRN